VEAGLVKRAAPCATSHSFFFNPLRRALVALIGFFSFGSPGPGRGSTCRAETVGLGHTPKTWVFFVYVCVSALFESSTPLGRLVASLLLLVFWVFGFCFGRSLPCLGWFCFAVPPPVFLSACYGSGGGLFGGVQVAWWCRLRTGRDHIMSESFFLSGRYNCFVSSLSLLQPLFCRSHTD